MIRLRVDSDRLRRTLRRREIEAVFRTVPDDTFEDALELGAGDGAQSQYIARCARKVLCTDLKSRSSSVHRCGKLSELCTAL